MDSANELGEQMLRIVLDVERAITTAGQKDKWPPHPLFSMELLEALANCEDFDPIAVTERLVANARSD
jgi:hypothetical protein